MKAKLFERIAAYTKKFSIITAMLSLFLVAGLITTSKPVMATTPDGETPANEGVCDVLKTNATPGLYGLCVAYCEAQDLDTFDKEPASSKILANYDKKKQAGDPDMPCVKVPCPCWSDAELSSITADHVAAACPSSTGKLQIIDNTPKTLFAEADINSGRERCRYIDLNVSPITVRSQAISPADAQNCYTAIQQACNSVGM